MMKAKRIQKMLSVVSASYERIYFCYNGLKYYQYILLAKITAAQNEVADSYDRVSGLCFMAAIIAGTVKFIPHRTSLTILIRSFALHIILVPRLIHDSGVWPDKLDIHPRILQQRIMPQPTP